MSRNFDANSANYISLGTDPVAMTLTDIWSVFIFFRVENTATDDRVLWNYGPSGGQGIGIRVDRGAAPQEIEVRVNGVTRINSSVSVQLNTWYMAALTSDGADTATSWTVYLIGMDGTVISSVTGDIVSNVTTGDLLIGRFLSNTTDLMDGDLAEFAYFDELFGQNKILEFFYNPAGFVSWHKNANSIYLPIEGSSPEPDFTGNGNNGTINGTLNVSDNPPVASLFGYGGASMAKVAVAASATGIMTPNTGFWGP